MNAVEDRVDDDDEDEDEDEDIVPRTPLVYLRGQAGSGKTFLARELVRGKNGPIRQKNIDPEVIKYADKAAVFLLSFNSRFSIDPAEEGKLVTNGGAYLPMWLRLLYIELARFKKLPWSVFLDDAVNAFVEKQLDTAVVAREAWDMLNARRGRSDAPLVVIVDELVQCGESLPEGHYTPKNPSAGDAYRSELCRRMDLCGGVVGATTVSQAFIMAERRSSPRTLQPGAVLRPLQSEVSRDFIASGVQALYDKGFEFNDAGEVVPSGAGIGRGTLQLDNLVNALVSVTGGHPRLVCKLASCLSSAGLNPSANFKSLLSAAVSFMAESRAGFPSLGTSEEFTEAVLRDLLLGTTRRFFDVVECQRVVPSGEVQEKTVPRLDGRPGLGYNYDEIALTRYLASSDYNATTFKALYRSRSPSCFIGSNKLLSHVVIDASCYRERVVSDVDLDAVLRLAEDPTRRNEVLHSLYVLSDGTMGIDAISFYECVDDCHPFKGQLLAEAKQFKYSLNASKTTLSCAVVSDAWSKTNKAFQSSWPSWKDRIVFVVVARRKRSVPASIAAVRALKDMEGILPGTEAN
eukprot:contig_17197_g4186